MSQILTTGDPRLRVKSSAVSAKELSSDAFQHVLDALIETMQKQKNGVGIAAPQVGIQKRAIIVTTSDGPQAFINPKIFSPSKELVESEEGCFSVPGVYGIVKRHRTIKIKATDRNGKPVRRSVDGFEAIIFQHEIDHLDGILFTDRAIRYTRTPAL